ncbi:DNA (cytosine-5)-methyltransferase DRM1 [Spatholobus suberectus]|nr:DNA (cytosine-5)-methyltransferase DRM1 [Spatholobus suberectus]
MDNPIVLSHLSFFFLLGSLVLIPMEHCSSEGASSSNYYDWNTNDELEVFGMPSPGPTYYSRKSFEHSVVESNASCLSAKYAELIHLFVGMGFSRETMIKAIDENGEDNKEDIMETLLTLTTFSQIMLYLQPYQPSDESYLYTSKRVKLLNNKWEDRICSPSKKTTSSIDMGMIHFSSPMTGFGIPNEVSPMISRKLPTEVVDKPYFYFENVAIAPKGVWNNISPPGTITDRIRKVLDKFGVEPPLSVQENVLQECRKWNLVWVGKNKLAPLKYDEYEKLLGFPKDHTRSGGVTQTKKYRALGNAFQVDTVAYHLSVLKGHFPNGINVLSLFSGIGGAEVALHRLGIMLKNVVSVEIVEVNKNIIRSWWEQTNQRGNLIEVEDV